MSDESNQPETAPEREGAQPAAERASESAQPNADAQASVSASGRQSRGGEDGPATGGAAYPTDAAAAQDRGSAQRDVPQGTRFSHPRPTATGAGASHEPRGKKRTERVKDFAYEKTPKRFKNASSFQVRLRTGTVYVALSVLCLMINDITTMVFLAATAGVCAGEFYYMLRSDAKLPNEMIGIIGAMLYPVSVFFFGIVGIVYTTLLLTLALTFWYVYWMRARVQDVGISMFGAVYIGMQLSMLMLMRMSIDQPYGGFLLLILFVSIWANDAFAYLVGSKIGRHKLAPRTSPNKSWEGFAAGLVASMVIWTFLVMVPQVNIDVYQAMLFGLLVGLASVLGDLCESRIKRSVGFKDSGTIMPGHGGLFDRCDSLLPAAVAAAVLLLGSGCLPFVI
ncbi:MAG: phosphatidate cytidylyltransferase [Eggerthellaceae bacterium]|jgi:phosphatidate cytidylyltransferase